jgi:hypothetical protein
MRRTFAVVALLVLAGCLGGPSATQSASDVTLTEAWRAGDSSVAGNHHAAAAGRADGEAVVAVPIGGRSGETGCRLLVLDGAGDERWTEPIAEDACTIHAVADVTLADFVGDDSPEVIAASTEAEVVAYDALSGESTFRYPLSNYGYSKPVVADATGDGTPELVVSDIDGTLAVVRQDGSTVWRRPLNAYSWAPPAVADFDADSRPETLVGLGNGSVVAFTRRGQVAWRTGLDSSVTWAGDGNVDDDPAREYLAATRGGDVVSLDGREGTVEWSRSVGDLAAVGDPVDGDGDGVVEVYATNRTGTLFALDGRDGSVEWTRSLTGAETQMTPPPVVGDVTGDGTPDVVAVTNDGGVHVVDPATGAVRGSYGRDASLFTHATLADTDSVERSSTGSAAQPRNGDGRKEVYVVYGDGVAVALSVQSSNSSSS